MKIIFLTPFFGPKSLFLESWKTIGSRVKDSDTWIVVTDNLSDDFSELETKNIKILNYQGPRGAGNARNHGLDFIKSNFKRFPYIVWPIDSDDDLMKDAQHQAIKIITKHEGNLFSFGVMRQSPSGNHEVGYEGKFKLKDLLKQYRTPCGSTVIKVDKYDFFENVRFGKRIRANDQLFFLSATKYYGNIYFFPITILKYNVGFRKTLSSNKMRMPKYKYLALRDFGLSRLESFYYLCWYFYENFRKLIKKGSV